METINLFRILGHIHWATIQNYMHLKMVLPIHRTQKKNGNLQQHQQIYIYLVFFNKLILIKLKQKKYAVADSIKTTSGIIAIVFLVALGLFIVFLDVFDLGITYCGKKGNVNQKKKKKKESQVKPIYLPHGCTK